MTTAAAKIERLNLRETRARQMASHIIHTLRPYLAEDCMPSAYNALMETLMIDGVEVLTDHDRDVHGLPPRGEDGWTHEELVALESSRLGKLVTPTSMVFPVKEE